MLVGVVLGKYKGWKCFCGNKMYRENREGRESKVCGFSDWIVRYFFLRRFSFFDYSVTFAF